MALKDCELLKPHQVATYIGIHRSTLARLARKDGFPQARNLGYGLSRVYRKSEIDEWLNRSWASSAVGSDFSPSGSLGLFESDADEEARNY